MAWDEKILETGLVIITGDEKQWNPLSMPSSNVFSYEFNTAEFEFPEVSGTKVDRRLPKSRRFPLEFFFQGDDNIEVSESFRLSANDLRAWTVIHPVYGQITGHPVGSMEFDNSGMISTKITVLFVESIDETGPKTIEDLKETTLTSTVEVEDLNAETFENRVDLEPSDTVLMQNNINGVYATAKKSISVNDIASEYFNLFNKASQKVNIALTAASIGMNIVGSFISYPWNFAMTVKERLKILKEQAYLLKNSIPKLKTKNEKKIFENNFVSIIIAFLKSSVSPIGDEYQNSTDVISVINEILNLYNGFVADINELQDEDATQGDAYIPDYQLLFSLNFSVNYAVANLFQIALQAQQERVIYLEQDSNIIIQAHRFYGLDQEDANLNKFVSTNNIGMRETLQLSKGRKLVYYV